jgi:hypothetical protein
VVVGSGSTRVVDLMLEFRRFKIRGMEEVVTRNRELRTPNSRSPDRIRTVRFEGDQSHRFVTRIYCDFGYRAKGFVALQFIDTRNPEVSKHWAQIAVEGHIRKIQGRIQRVISPFQVSRD